MALLREMASCHFQCAKPICQNESGVHPPLGCNSANFNHGCQCHSTALLKNEANTCHADARNAPNFQCFARCWVLSRFLHPEKSKGTASPQGQGAKIAGRPSSLQPNAKKGSAKSFGKTFLRSSHVKALASPPALP